MVQCLDSTEFKGCSAQRDKKADKKTGKSRKVEGAAARGDPIVEPTDHRLGSS